MASIDDRIAIWKERLTSTNEDIREGAGLSMLMQIQSGGWRKTDYPGEYSLELPEGYGQLKALLTAAVEKGTLKSEPVVEWVNERKKEALEVEQTFDAVFKGKIAKHRPKAGYKA